MTVPNAAARVAEAWCRICLGRVANLDVGTPHGWYQVTVGVPEFMESVKGRGYLWVGMYCSSACLAAGVPDIIKQEEMARQVYDPAVPYHP